VLVPGTVQQTDRNAEFVRGDPGSAEVAIGWRQEPYSVSHREIRRDGFLARELFVAIEEQLVARALVNPACGAHSVSS